MNNQIECNVGDDARPKPMRLRATRSKVTLARLLGATAFAAIAIRLFQLTSTWESWVPWCLIFAIGGSAIGIATHGFRGFLGGLCVGAAVAVGFLLFG